MALKKEMRFPSEWFIEFRAHESEGLVQQFLQIHDCKRRQFLQVLIPTSKATN